MISPAMWLAAVGMFLTVMANSANASLIGETITAAGDSVAPASATVGPGVEFNGISFQKFVNFDFDANTLTITPNADFASVSWLSFGKVVFSNFTSDITGFSLASNSGFTGTLLTDYGFTLHGLSLDFAQGLAHRGDRVVFNIATAQESRQVPEPGPLALFGIGLAGFALSRRKTPI